MGTVAQRDLYKMINDATARGERVVVATVARTRGSTPQQRGAKMLFSKMTKLPERLGAVASKLKFGRRRVTPGVQANPRCITSR